MDAYIFDMDGTLCNVEPVRHFVRDKPKDFDAFHRGATTICEPHDWVAQAARDAAAEGIKVLVVSARMATWAKATLDWADRFEIPWHDAWFRPLNDYRPDHIVKREIYHDICSRGYNVVKAYDDNPSIVDLWRELQVECVVVPGWGDENPVYNHGE